MSLNCHHHLKFFFKIFEISFFNNSSLKTLYGNVTDGMGDELLMATTWLRKVPLYTTPKAPTPMFSPKDISENGTNLAEFTNS